MGVYGGGALGLLIGGHVAHVYGWRMRVLPGRPARPAASR